MRSSQVYFFDRATPGALKLAEQAKLSGAIVFFEPPKIDTGDAHFDRALRLADVVKVAGSIGKTREVEEALEEVPLALVTVGEHGMYSSSICQDTKGSSLSKTFSLF